MSNPNLRPPSVVQIAVDQQTRRLAFIGVAVSVLVSFMALATSLRQPEPPVFVSVSVKSLVEEHMMSVVGRDISQTEAERRTIEYIASLEAAIEELAQDESVIVIASEAVLGPSVPDFTNDIRLMARQRAEVLANERGESLPPLGDVSGYENMIGRLAAETKALGKRLDGSPGGEGGGQ